MSAPPRTGHDGKQAAFVLAAVAALLAIPALIANRVPERETLVEAGTRLAVSAPGEEPDTVTFAGVDGWAQRPTGDPATAVVRSPEETVLIVTVANGVTDFPAAADWRLEVLALQGFEGVFDGGQVQTPNGFAGPTCQGDGQAGVCAIVGKDNLVVTLALSGRTASFDQLAPVLETLAVEQ
ncbi:hypothetical protein [Nocardia sp. NPDC050406]|uniref:hypothetical protein n=1 Tax=Nocardia sp. NPDC050406 TaxID=3364318 RepID=UPI0037A8FD4B